MTNQIKVRGSDRAARLLRRDRVNYYFEVPVKSLDCVADIIKWLRLIGCKAWQYKSTWTILCVTPADKAAQVMDAYNNRFGW